MTALTTARQEISTASCRQLRAAAKTWGVSLRASGQLLKTEELRTAILSVIDEKIAAEAPVLQASTTRVTRAANMADLISQLRYAEIGAQFKLSAKQVARELAAYRLYSRDAIRQLFETGQITWEQIYKAAAYSMKNSDEFFIEKLTA